MSKSEKRTLEDAATYLFMEGFNDESCAKAIRFILEQNLLPLDKRPRNIKFIICSPGGDLSACLALVDTMKSSMIPVHTIGIGQICSCGIIAFMAGVKGERKITMNTSILSHQWAWGTHGKEHELFAVVREYEITSQRIMRHYRKCTGMTDEAIREVLLPPQDIWLSPEEALQYGIADAIVETY